MHRSTLITILTNYLPNNSAEQIFKNQILEFISKNLDCFERSLPIGHITASSWLLSKDHTKVLLMHHTKLDKWFQLGGHCDGNPDTLQIAIKEAQEESGINAIEAVHYSIYDIDIHLIPANSKEEEHYHYDIRFLLQVTSDETISQNNESKELRWIGKNHHELPTSSESVVRMFNKWILLDDLHQQE